MKKAAAEMKGATVIRALARDRLRFNGAAAAVTKMEKGAAAGSREGTSAGIAGRGCTSHCLPRADGREANAAAP